MQPSLDASFAALADPTRRAMLVRLARGEANVSDLAAPFLRTMSLPAVTKHLQVLERAGLITKHRQAQRRPCRLNPQALKPVADWVEQYRQYWEESFDRLDDYLKTVTAKTQTTQTKQTQARPRRRKRKKGLAHGRKRQKFPTP